MSYSKLAQIALYVTMGISILIILFFYFGDSLVNTEKYEAKVAKLEAPAEMTTGFDYQADMAVEEDSTAVEADSTVAEEAVDSTVIEEVEEEMLPTEPLQQETVRLNLMEKLVYKRTDIALTWAYILVILTLIASIGFPLVHMISNPQGLVRGLVILVAIAVMVGIAYMLGSGDTINIVGYDGTDNSNPRVLRLVDMGLITSYFLLGLTLLSILYSSVSKYFK
jgi:hypothetical protein